MDFLSQTYIALRGPTGAPQTASDTIARLSDRLQPSTLLADRRAAVLSLKGLTRDWKQDVGEKALPGLLAVLQNDAEIDADIAKAALETLKQLCDVEEGPKELALKHTDAVLADEPTVNILFSLLADTTFYTRYATLQLLTTLLQNRRQVVQGYFLKAPSGATNIIAILDDKREIIRNETIAMIQALTAQSPDIQKVFAFEGAFEKLFNIVTQENGVEGGVISADALQCADGLLRFNTSNQSYFRETSLPALLCSLLIFPPQLQMDEVPPQEFALQFWDQQKAANVSLVLGIMGMLVGSKGNGGPETGAFIRCFIELALASNAPTHLKTQALRLLPINLNFPLSNVILTPYIPVPETNGEEWDRLEASSALDVLVELALHGEYNGQNGGKRTVSSLELRSAAMVVFENFVRKDEVKQAIVQGMIPPDPPVQAPSISPLLHALCLPPSIPPNLADVTTTHVASILFSHLLAFSPRSKSLARSIKPIPIIPQTPSQGGQFFVPADGNPPPQQQEVDDGDEDGPETLLQLLSENLSLCFLSRSRAAQEDERQAREWDRLIVGYLCLLSRWLWEDPKSVRDFLNAGSLGSLVEPINHNTEGDSLVPGLCAFLLGVCYEYNREPGEITRSAISPIISRLSIDAITGQMTRLREDERFKSVGPDTMVFATPVPHDIQNGNEPEGEIWFDWAFVDFWKSSYYAVQRGLGMDPNTLSASAGPDVESTMLISSLRDVIRSQATEIDDLKEKLKAASSQEVKIADMQAKIAALESQLSEASSAQSKVAELETKAAESAAAQNKIAELEAKVTEATQKQKDTEKEQEDLLVLLDEMSTKRKRDKARMAEKGLEVSEDEGDEDDDEDDDEDEEDSDEDEDEE